MVFIWVPVTLLLSQEVFPAEFGSQYDRDLQTLFWEFYCRLAQLLPVPDVEQVRGVVLINTVCNNKICSINHYDLVSHYIGSLYKY